MRPYCVGLTGGIGSGKSTAAELFARQGVAVVDTDAISRELTSTKGQALNEIVEAFGTACLDADGALDRQVMRAWIFSDTHARRRLEQILHPLIRKEAAERLSRVAGLYAILVVPLLTEHLDDYKHLLDRIAVVDCDEVQQLQRLIARPGMTEGQAEAIMASQCGRANRLAIADDVIDNRGDMQDLLRQVMALHERYSRLAEEKMATRPTTRCTK